MNGNDAPSSALLEVRGLKKKLVDDLTIWQNVFLGGELVWGPFRIPARAGDGRTGNPDPLRFGDQGAPDQRSEVEALIERLRTAGRTFLLISHNFGEVMRLSDEVWIMHHGRVVGHRRTANTSGDELVSLITGAAAPSEPPRK